MKTFFTKAYAWIDERMQLGDLVQFMGKKYVPINRHSIWYYFGGVTLFLFIVQVVTGIMLLMYYVPSAEQAYESVYYIMAQVHFGWLVRSIHAWSARPSSVLAGCSSKTVRGRRRLTRRPPVGGSVARRGANTSRSTSPKATERGRSG